MSRRAAFIVAVIVALLGDIMATMSLVSDLSSPLAYIMPSLVATGYLVAFLVLLKA